jgi:hypothetical protein
MALLFVFVDNARDCIPEHSEVKAARVRRKRKAWLSLENVLLD